LTTLGDVAVLSAERWERGRDRVRVREFALTLNAALL
jgi:hypothetical protein